MNVLDAVRDSIREYGMLTGADTVICALSGGPDSVCLADALLTLAPELGFKLECAHFNHLLRGAESKRDADFTKDWCAGRGLKLYYGSGDAAAFAAEHRMGIEEAARELRYDFLDGLCGEHTRIATAHQAEDQAETLLLNLLRGSGLKGLGGIPPVRGNYIRPLLRVGREKIMEYLRNHGLCYVEDSSNRDTAFRRNRLRHEVMPVLKELNPSFTEACGRTARLLRADEELLNELAQKEFTVETDCAVLSAAKLRELPTPLSSRALRSAAGSFGVQPEEKHITAMLALACSEEPSAKLDLPGGLEARRQYDRLLISRQTEIETIPERELSFGAWTEVFPQKLRVFWGETSEAGKINGKFTTYFFKKDRICGTIKVRSRREGDRLCLPGRPGKSLKKWLIQEKVPAARRESIPVFADEIGVLAVLGLGADVRAVASPETADSVLIIMERT